MSFLLDTDICSAYLKNHPRVVNKVMLHFGGLHVSVVTVGELLTWARRATAPPSRLQGVNDLLKAAIVHEIDTAAAERFGVLRAGLLDRGITVGQMDLLNASVALTHNLTVATHNTQDYANVPGLHAGRLDEPLTRKRLEVTLKPRGDAELELWGARSKRALFADV